MHISPALPPKVNVGLKSASWALTVPALLLTLLAGSAQTLRVTGWNLNGVSDRTRVKEVADNLKPLNPDVILLQGVRDWQMCSWLAEALKPEQYNVAICSAFRPGELSEGANAQVAVLSKSKAYFSWSEPWKSGEGAGGFVFVALQWRGRRIGLFSANVVNPPSAAEHLQELLEQKEAVGRWEANRVQSFVIGLSFAEGNTIQQAELDSAVARFQRAGFIDALDALAPDQRATISAMAGQVAVTADFILVQPNVFPSPQRPRASLLGRYPVTCDLELEPGRVTAAWTARAQELQHRSTAMGSQAPAPAPGSSVPQPPASTSPPGWWWSIGGAMAMSLVFLMWFISRSARRAPPSNTPLLPGHVPPQLTAASYTVVVSSPSVAESATGETPSSPVFQVEVPRMPAQSANWQQRALTAEQEAEKAKLLLKHTLTARLDRWFKQKFVRKLMADRAQLLESQESTVLKAIQVDERLARIEQQIRQQTQSYERRIEELTVELHAAREENRELIRARIAQVKLEMETARARMRAEANAQ